MTLRGDFAMSFCDRCKYLICLLPAEMSLCVFPQELAGQGKAVPPCPTGPQGRDVPGNGCLWVMEKEILAAGSSVPSRDRSGHVPRLQQLGEEELSLWVWGEAGRLCAAQEAPKLGKRIQPAKATEGELVFRKPWAAGTALVPAMCKTKPRL